jgi:hypothetical protein
VKLSFRSSSEAHLNAAGLRNEMTVRSAPVAKMQTRHDRRRKYPEVVPSFGTRDVHRVEADGLHPVPSQNVRKRQVEDLEPVVNSSLLS